jgi:hypothetical protein
MVADAPHVLGADGDCGQSLVITATFRRFSLRRPSTIDSAYRLLTQPIDDRLGPSTIDWLSTIGLSTIDYRLSTTRPVPAGVKQYPSPCTVWMNRG